MSSPSISKVTEKSLKGICDKDGFYRLIEKEENGEISKVIHGIKLDHHKSKKHQKIFTKAVHLITNDDYHISRTAYTFGDHVFRKILDKRLYAMEEECGKYYVVMKKNVGEGTEEYCLSLARKENFDNLTKALENYERI